MNQPQITRPDFPPGYVENPKALLTWAAVEERLSKAKNYWLCSVRPNGRPHAIPRWAVWVAGKIYYDGSPETRHARNVAVNPHIALHLESGDEVVIVEGVVKAVEKPSVELGQQVAQSYRTKYADLGYAPEPTQWDNGGLSEVTLRRVLAWTKFSDDPTKFVFEENK